MHYEVLNIAGTMRRRFSLPMRVDLLLLVVAAIIAHVVGICLFALAYAWMHHHPEPWRSRRLVFRKRSGFLLFLGYLLHDDRLWRSLCHWADANRCCLGGSQRTRPDRLVSIVRIRIDFGSVEAEARLTRVAKVVFLRHSCSRRKGAAGFFPSGAKEPVTVYLNVPHRALFKIRHCTVIRTARCYSVVIAAITPYWGG